MGLDDLYFKVTYMFTFFMSCLLVENGQLSATEVAKEKLRGRFLYTVELRTKKILW